MSTRYRLIGTSDLDAPLLEAWRKTQASDPCFQSPYFSPEFTLAVASVRSNVRVVLIEQDNQPVGFFPHERNRWGTGRPVGGPMSDYHGVLMRPNIEWSLASLMKAADLSTWAFDHLVISDDRFTPHLRARSTSPQMDLSAGYDQYVKDRREAGSDYIPKTEALTRKLVREMGELHFAFHDSSAETLALLLKWKSAQYVGAGLTDLFEVPWTGGLLNRIATTQNENFAGVCSVLRVGDRPVAAHIGMRSNTSLHYWFPAYDPCFTKFSVGIALLLRIAREAAASGLTRIDLGKGDSQYKQRLMSCAVPLGEGIVRTPSLCGVLSRARQTAEDWNSRGVFGLALRLPLKAVRRIERARRLR